MSELDEFYPYVEMSHVAQNPERFKGSFKGGECATERSFHLTFWHGFRCRLAGAVPQELA
jgi:hypothetical protein